MFFFAVWAGGPGPAQTAKQNKKKKKTPPPKQKKNVHAPRPVRACFCFYCLGGWSVVFFAVWAGCVCFFCCLGGVRVFFAVWAGCVHFFCCLGGWRVRFFAVWAGGVFLFCCLGRVRVFFLLLERGTGVHSPTGLPGSSLSDPTTKKDETAKQKKEVPLEGEG